MVPLILDGVFKRTKCVGLLMPNCLLKDLLQLPMPGLLQHTAGPKTGCPE